MHPKNILQQQKGLYFEITQRMGLRFPIYPPGGTLKRCNNWAVSDANMSTAFNKKDRIPVRYHGSTPLYSELTL